MARPLRIAYPGAWYHVMNRGRRAEEIFIDKGDYELFVDLLQETAEMWNIRVAAYCLMPNHYHMLVQTPDANIARSMRHINGVYTQRFNRRHQCDGQLFRGRYKSILVDGDSYVLQVVRYIHRNPLQAGLVGRLGDYVWSSHRGYVSVAKKWEWLHKEFVFGLLCEDKKLWLKTYRQFMALETDEDIVRMIEGKKWPSMLGPKSFTDWVKGRYYGLKDDGEIPQAKELAPESEIIMDVVCSFYEVKRDHLFKSKRGLFNEPRNVAVYLMRKTRREGLKQIGSHFGIESYSTVSSIIERVKSQLDTDKKLQKRLIELEETIRKSQQQT
jgi:REP element-mobilizing transposase RayT